MPVFDLFQQLAETRHFRLERANALIAASCGLSTALRPHDGQIPAGVVNVSWLSIGDTCRWSKRLA